MTLGSGELPADFHVTARVLQEETFFLGRVEPSRYEQTSGLMHVKATVKIMWIDYFRILYVAVGFEHASKEIREALGNPKDTVEITEGFYEATRQAVKVIKAKERELRKRAKNCDLIQPYKKDPVEIG